MMPVLNAYPDGNERDEGNRKGKQACKNEKYPEKEFFEGQRVFKQDHGAHLS